MRDLNHFLQQRGDRWHYVRRVPRQYIKYDDRGTIRVSLKTKSIEVARKRRDDMAEADDLYWARFSSADCDNASAVQQQKLLNLATQRYDQAKRFAMAKGFPYQPNSDLIKGDISELLKRIEALPENKLPTREEAEALLGLTPEPHYSVKQAFEIYCDVISTQQILGKSDEQKRNWRKVKQRAINNFIALNGNIPMHMIQRKHANTLREWWAERLIPSADGTTRSPNSANRDIGNMRKFYKEFWEYRGEPDRLNPFRNISFTNLHQ